MLRQMHKHWRIKNMDGILPLWKPKGLTSHDCVVKVRKLFNMKKVGHTGTLDPAVEGVLPICLGQATKIVPFLMDTKKTYIAEIKLGESTETEDAEGKVIETKKVDAPLPDEKIEQVLNSFKGVVTQIPPMYSAVKVKGKRLYEYARNNEEVERPKRQVTIFEIERLVAKQQNQHFIKIKVVCSKGTYIRTLCADIGKSLGYPAHMHSLIRTETGSINREDTVTFSHMEEAIKQGNEAKLLLPISRGLTHLDELSVNLETKKKVQYGQKLPRPDQVMKTNPFVVKYKDELLAVYENHSEKLDQIKPVRVFISK